MTPFLRRRNCLCFHFQWWGWIFGGKQALWTCRPRVYLEADRQLSDEAPTTYGVLGGCKMKNTSPPFFLCPKAMPHDYGHKSNLINNRFLTSQPSLIPSQKRVNFKTDTGVDRLFKIFKWVKKKRKKRALIISNSLDLLMACKTWGM